MSTSHIVAAVIAIGAVAPAAYFAFDRQPCVDIKSTQLLTPEVYPGGKLRFEVVVDRHDMCEYRRTSYLKDGANVIIPYAPLSLGSDGVPRKDEVVVLEETVPEGATPGPAEYFRWGHYRRSVINDYWPLPPVLIADLKFTILKPQEGTP